MCSKAYNGVVIILIIDQNLIDCQLVQPLRLVAHAVTFSGQITYTVETHIAIKPYPHCISSISAGQCKRPHFHACRGPRRDGGIQAGGTPLQISVITTTCTQN